VIIVIPKVTTLDPHVSLFCYSFCLIWPFHFRRLCPSTPSASGSRVWKSRRAVKVLTAVFEGSGPPHQQEKVKSVYMLVCVWKECWWWRWPLIGRSVLWGEWDLYTAAQAGICAWEVFNFLPIALSRRGPHFLPTALLSRLPLCLDPKYVCMLGVGAPEDWLDNGSAVR